MVLPPPDLSGWDLPLEVTALQRLYYGFQFNRGLALISADGHTRHGLLSLRYHIQLTPPLIAQ